MVADSETTTDVGDNDLLLKGKIFLKSLNDMMKSSDGKTAIAVSKTIWENKKLTALAAATPARAGVVVTSVMIRKSMHLAGINTKDQAALCVQAVAKLGSTLAIGAAIGASTAGIGALMMIVTAALDGYEVGNQCFNNNGAINHGISL